MVDPSESTVITVISGVSRGLMDRGDACLVVTYGAELGRRYVLDRPEMVVGRSRGCDIHLEQDSTSRRHAVVRYSAGAYQVQDMGSTNGTSVNDETVSDRRLEDGDELRFGRTVMKFLAGEELERKYRECLVAVARTDGLTGATTASAFHELVADEGARARRYQRWLSLVTLELTGWDAYADQAGRIYSDLRLRRIAQLIGGQLRTSDVLARMDESEFAMLLPETSQEQVSGYVERVSELIADELDGLSLTVGSCSAFGDECSERKLWSEARRRR